MEGNMSPTNATLVKPLLPITRGIFLVSVFLAGIAGIQLYILTEHTDRFFAWTIANPLSAAFIGTGYWTGTLALTLSLRERAWANVRIAMAAVGPFVPLMLLVTLLHLDKFHFQSDDLGARVAAWSWLIVYLVVPFAVIAIFALQMRAPGGDPEEGAMLPRWVRALVGVNAATWLVVGLALLLIPDRLFALWPWALTALTARAIAVGWISAAFALAQFFRDNSWGAGRVGGMAYLLLGSLQLIALLRYAGQVEWGRPGAWLYLLFMLVVVASGLYTTIVAWMPFMPRTMRSIATS
jgi:hypothetical protein